MIGAVTRRTRCGWVDACVDMALSVCLCSRQQANVHTWSKTRALAPLHNRIAPCVSMPADSEFVRVHTTVPMPAA